MKKFFPIFFAVLLICSLAPPCQAFGSQPETIAYTDEFPSMVVCTDSFDGTIALTDSKYPNEIISVSQEVLEDGIEIITVTTVTESTFRSMSKAYTREQTFIRDGVTIGVIAINATFRYDGNTVSVVSKSISKCETYDGWSFKQSSFTSSGGTVTLTGKLTKLLVLNANVNISLTCDKNGNIS